METRGSESRRSSLPTRERAHFSALSTALSSAASRLRPHNPDTETSPPSSTPATGSTLSAAAPEENPGAEGVPAATWHSEEIPPNSDFTPQIEIHGSEKQRLAARKRKPLSDLSNAPFTHSHLKHPNLDAKLSPSSILDARSTSTNALEENPEGKGVANATSLSKEILLDSDAIFDDRSTRKQNVQSNLNILRPSPPTAGAKSISNIAPEENPEGLGIPAVTPQSKEIPPDSDAAVHHPSCSVVYTRQRAPRRKYKGKSIVAAATSSCPPLGRIARARNRRESTLADVGRTEALSVPCAKPTKRISMPQSFVAKQRAYFMEVDEFELPEEVVSESELEDRADVSK